MRYFGHYLVFLLGLTITCINVNAAGFADAETAIGRGDYATAVPILESLAKDNDADAMVALAKLYQTGSGVKKDLTRTVSLFTAAAERDNAEAEFSLGNLYLMGEGVPQDEDWAFTYYRRAADHGHALAQKNVNEFYRAAGISPPPPNNSSSSVENQTPPAATTADSPPSPEPGTAPIPTTLSDDELHAIDNARARGFTIDLEASTTPPPQPINNTHSQAHENPAPTQVTMVEEPSAAASLKDIRELIAVGDSVRAQAALEPLANRNNAEAQFLLAQMLDTAPGGSTSQDQALAWLKLSATAGFPEAEFKLAERYLSGHGVTKDDAEAITWYRAAARHGHDGAKQKLEAIYRDAGLQAHNPAQ